jgi:hypothetical protein
MECPVCGDQLARVVADRQRVGTVSVKCRRCGNFGLTDSEVSTLPEQLKRVDALYKISHVLRKATEAQNYLLLDTDTAEEILKHPLPRPREQADLLIQWIALNSSGPGEHINIEFKTHGSIVGAKSDAGLNLLFEHLISKGIVSGYQSNAITGEAKANLALTFSGWDEYEKLRLGSATYHKAFMAMKFGDPDLNMMLDSAFKRAAERAGFDLFKLDDQPKAGLIDDRMRVEIRASDFVIADLTHGNLGAYWEAGFAEGLGKPVIYTCKRSTFIQSGTHFDTNHHLTILWEIDKPQEAEQLLVDTIRASLPHLAKLTDN